MLSCRVVQAKVKRYIVVSLGVRIPVPLVDASIRAISLGKALHFILKWRNRL